MKNSKIVLICLTLVSSIMLLMGCEVSNVVTTTVATTEKIVETKVAVTEEKETVKEITKETTKKDTAKSVNANSRFKALTSEQARVDSKDYAEFDGDMFIQRVTANARGGVQWNFISLKDKMMLEDEISNFYDVESTTEVGEISYFLRAIRKGDDILMFTLYDTKSGEIYCVVKYYITVDTKLSDSGYNIINLNKREIFDYRPNAMAAYGFSEPEIIYHARGNGN